MFNGSLLFTLFIIHQTQMSERDTLHVYERIANRLCAFPSGGFTR